MELGAEIHRGFTRPGISMEDQTNLIDDLSRRRIPLRKSFRSNVVHAYNFRTMTYDTSGKPANFPTGSGPSHGTIALQSRFQPFGRPNVENLSG